MKILAMKQLERTYESRQPLGRDDELGQVEPLGGIVQEGRKSREIRRALCGCTGRL